MSIPASRPRRLSVSLKRASALAVIAVLASTLSGAPPTAAAVTEADVNAACANSADALATYRNEKALFDEAASQLDETRYRLEDTQLTVLGLEELMRQRQESADQLQERAVNAAVQLYMSARQDAITGVVLDDPTLVAVASELLSASAASNIQTINNLTVARTEIGEMAAEFAQVATELSDLEINHAAARASQETAMVGSLTAYEQLDSTCRTLQAEYEAEEARRRAEEAARRGSAGGGLPPGATPGFVCPFTPGRTQFIDSWGFPRSGGRTHKGADMFAVWDEPVYAVADGTVAVEEHGIGGKHIWLSSSYGTAYYYAHLSGFAVGDGEQVSTGQLIGYNGNSGNAAGTSPHVHFQIHPNGRSRNAVNPYPTVAAACF